MFNYASINEAGICTGVQQSATAVLADNLIGLSTYNMALLGQQYADGVFSVIEVRLEDTEREWRNNELANSDAIIKVGDHPERLKYELYRELLRDWPQTVDFPNTRPTLEDVELMPQNITQLDLIRLLMTYAGSTSADIMSAKADVDMAFFWLMFEMAQYVSKDDPQIDESLDALALKGIIDTKANVLNNWPTVSNTM